MSDLTTTFTNIANAIRSKTGSSDTMTPSEMPDEIAGIETPMDSINITQNGTYEPSAGRGYNQVIVEVPAPTLITKTITANGTYTASEDNADGYSQVTVAVDGFKKKSIANTPTDIASFNDGTANPMPSLEISIVPVQSGSGDPSPSNVRPISGWGGANVTRCGANVWDEEWEQGYYDASGIPDPSPYAIRSKNYIPVKPSTTYYIYNGFDSNGRLQFYDANKNWVSTSTGTNRSFTTADNCYFIKFSTATTYGGTYNNDISINYPATDTSYHAYNGSTTSIPFHDSSDNPITVYGGRLDVTTGELTVTHTKYELREEWQWQASSRYPGAFYIFIGSIGVPLKPNTLVKCSHAIGIDTIEDYTFGTILLNDAINIYIMGTESTVADFKTYITNQRNANHPIEVCAELATPITYQLTPAQVTTLLGQNNIFADCGQVLEGEYFVTL